MTEHANWRSEYPFKSKFLDLDGHRYHYVDEGTGRETILCVHGNPTWSFYWRILIGHFRGAYRVVAVDHMGCGLSDKPQQYPYVLAKHADNLRRLVEYLDLERITLVAHDWGGAIGLRAAERQAALFRRLVLLNTGAFRSTRIPWRIAACRVPWLGPFGVRGLNAFARAATWMAVADRRRLSASAKAGLLAPYDSWRNRVAIQRFVEDIPMRPEHPSYDTLCALEEALPRLQELPIALIWGLRDWCFTPWFRDRFLDFFPRAEQYDIADAGHYVMEEAPERVIQSIETFMSRHPCPTSLPT